MKALGLVVSDKKIFENCILKTYFLTPWPTYATNWNNLNNFDRGPPRDHSCEVWSKSKMLCCDESNSSNNIVCDMCSIHFSWKPFWELHQQNVWINQTFSMWHVSFSMACYIWQLLLGTASRPSTLISICPTESVSGVATSIKLFPPICTLYGQ